MSESRRPARSKKPINYSLFADEGDNSDGDFADPTPPPNKRVKRDRQKSDKKPDKKQKEKIKKDVTSNKVTKRKERPPLGDKLFDRDLELALELSRQDSQTSSQSDSDGVQYMGNRKKEIAVVVHSTEAKPEETKPQPDPLRTDETEQCNDNKENMDNQDVVHTSVETKTSPNVVNIEEESLTLIETLEGSDAERGGRTRRKAASAAVAKQREMMSEEDGGDVDGDDEFKADVLENDFAASDSDDDFDAGDADSDFEGSTSKNKKKGKSSKARGREKKTPKARTGKKEGTRTKAKPTEKANSVVSSRPKSSLKTPVTPITRRPQPKGPVRGFTPPSISKVSNGDKISQQTSISNSRSAARKPSWCSPTSSSGNNPLGGVRLVSPSQPLRLGLSRHARTKPLHSNVKAP